MNQFDWRVAEEVALANRYGEMVIGHDAWKGLLDKLHATQSSRDHLDAFDTFLDSASKIPRRPLHCVFISHRRQDAPSGERVACLAEHCGFDCWLDIYDPSLQAVNNSQIPD